NVHVIVEEFTSNDTVQETVSQQDTLITFSAKKEKSISLFARELQLYVAKHPELNLNQLSQNLSRRTAPFSFQQSLRVSSREELLETLQKVSDGEIKPIQRLGDFSFPVF